jgi:hypothetical protein
VAFYVGGGGGVTKICEKIQFRLKSDKITGTSREEIPKSV